MHCHCFFRGSLFTVIDATVAHFVSKLSIPVYFIVRSLVNHVTDERRKKKDEAKARATAGKCHDQHHSWWDISWCCSSWWLCYDHGVRHL